MRDNDVSISRKIDKYKELIDNKETEIYEAQLIVDSLKNTMAGFVREIGRYQIVPFTIIEKAHKEKKEKVKNSYDFVEEIYVASVFTDRKAKLKDIIPFGRSSYAYALYFECDGEDFEIKVPCWSSANKENLYDLNYGKQSLLYKESEHTWTYLEESYDIDDLKKKVDEFFENKECEKC